jgi:hypothetical protein
VSGGLLTFAPSEKEETSQNEEPEQLINTTRTSTHIRKEEEKAAADGFK